MCMNTTNSTEKNAHLSVGPAGNIDKVGRFKQIRRDFGHDPDASKKRKIATYAEFERQSKLADKPDPNASTAFATNNKALG